MEAWHQGVRPALEASVAPPTLILHGELDRVIPIANAALLATRWPGAEVEVFPGCGHALMAQEPERVAAAICALVEG